MKKLLVKLSKLKKEQILDILSKTMEKDAPFEIKLQNFVDCRFDQLARQNEINDDISKYRELWGEAERIIDELNEYGGGPEEDEDTAYNNLNKIVELFKQGNLHENIKKEFVEKCVYFFDLGNSGMDDALIEACFDICEKRDDWLFLIGKLKKVGRDYATRLIMRIYRNYLNDDEGYLQLRMNNLHYGTDYYDLVKYYNNKGDKQRAFETALEGLKKGEGRIIDLIIYLQEYYKNKKDHANALKYHQLIFKEGPSLDSYKQIKNFCIGDEWKIVSKELYEQISSKEWIKRQIDFKNKEYQTVFESITTTEFSFDDEWARKLEPFFPKELIEIYQQKIKQNIEYKKVGAYFTAVSYCFRVKHILKSTLNKKEDWSRYLNSLKENYPQLPALQRELRRLEDHMEEDND